jgi:hypothetical protein
MVNQELIPTDTSELAAQARAAYEQKRIRECLSLTKTLLEADPENSEAQVLQSAIRADIRQDLHDARSLLEQSGTKDEQKKYRKAAEIILIKTLHVEPEDKEAKMLLQSARAMSGRGQQPVSTMTEMPQVSAMPHASQMSENPGAEGAAEELPFTVAPLLSQKKEEKKTRLSIPLVAAAIIVLVVGLVVMRHFRRSNPNALAAPVERAESVKRSDVPATSTPYSPTPASAQITTPAKPPVANQTPVASTPAAAPSTATPAGTPAGGSNAASEMGRLAVSSTIPAEIYLGNKNLGSTPTTVQLPAGRQTLEFRHGDLRTVVNYTIKANETISAAITFQVNVQINAKPWAQVFLEGPPRRPLGQTPLSGITVPVSGVLVFDNPNFPSKSYKITEKDSAIQVNFP